MSDLTDKDQMTIKEAFDFLMKEHFSDYSTYKVEKMSGLSGNAIHKVLTGYSPATFRIVEALAKAVGKQPYIMFSTRTSKQIKEARVKAQAKLERLESLKRLDDMTLEDFEKDIDDQIEIMRNK